jgi:alkylation response protein AidB-like acyl-CoA dehydrogenase
VLEGAKAVVLHGEAADAFVVSARTSGNADDEAGISLFLVDAEAAGISLRGYPLIDGGRAAELLLAGVRVGADALLGQEGAGHAVLEAAVGKGILACAPRARARCTSQRKRRSSTCAPQAVWRAARQFQALQHRMADAALRSSRRARPSSMPPPRWRATGWPRARPVGRQVHDRTSRNAGGRGVSCVHGGIGMTWELPLAHFAKRLVMIDHQPATRIIISSAMWRGNGSRHE